MAKRRKDFCGLTVTLSDELRMALLRSVIEYEAAVRGLSRGQAVVQLVLEAVDLDSYPEEVRERIDKIAERTRKRAIADALAVGERPRVA